MGSQVKASAAFEPSPSDGAGDVRWCRRALGAVLSAAAMVLASTVPSPALAQATLTVVVSPSDDTCVGTVIETANRRPLGSSAYLDVSARHMALLRFDLSDIPPSAGVVSARLRLFLLRTHAYDPIGAYRITDPWDEHTTTAYGCAAHRRHAGERRVDGGGCETRLRRLGPDVARSVMGERTRREQRCRRVGRGGFGTADSVWQPGGPLRHTPADRRGMSRTAEGERPGRPVRRGPLVLPVRLGRRVWPVRRVQRVARDRPVPRGLPGRRVARVPRVPLGRRAPRVALVPPVQPGRRVRRGRRVASGRPVQPVAWVRPEPRARRVMPGRPDRRGRRGRPAEWVRRARRGRPVIRARRGRRGRRAMWVRRARPEPRGRPVTWARRAPRVRRAM
jgi:hypothetical protein